MKEISQLERNRRRHQNMLASLSNKMNGSNEIWWESLSLDAKYALLFRFLKSKKDTKFKFKHFIEKYKPKFVPPKSNVRNVIIDHLFE